MTTADAASDVRYFEALAHLTSAAGAQKDLRNLYADPLAEDRSSRAAALHQRIGQDLKAAQVVALLAVADAIAGHGDQIMAPHRLEEAERLDEAEAAPIGEVGMQSLGGVR